MNAPGPAAGQAADFIHAIIDPGSFVTWDDDGAVESVVTGAATIRDRPIALAVSDFGVQGGSVGVAAATRLCRALNRAARFGLPFLAAPASGGTRMSEGTAAFLTMIPITEAVAALKAAGLPYLVYLRHPVTGGVLASWGSAGHLTAAAPHALVGFLGPRVTEALTGKKMPPGVQVAENLQAHGVIDAVLVPHELPELIDRFLAVVAEGRAAGVPAAESATSEAWASPPDEEAGTPPDAWQAVQATRDPRREGVRDLLACATGVVELSGSGEGDIEPGVVLALAGFGHSGCVLAGHDRAARGPVGVAGLRVLRRGIRLAAELRLPLITVIDTGGAELSQRAEEAGLAGQVSRCLIEMAQVAAPSVSVLLGQGAGGAAIALLPADRVIAAEHGWVAPVAPEGGSAIVHRDPGCAAEMARAQGIGAWDLRRNGIVDRIVAERGAQRGTPPGTGLAKRVALVLAEELGHLAAATSALPPERTRAVRHSRAARITRMMTERDEARPLRSGRTCPT